MARHPAFVVAGTLFLAACATGTGFTFATDTLNQINFGYTFEESRACAAAAAEKTKGIDWAKARRVAIRIDREDFTPSSFSLELGRPYVLRFTNADDRLHTFHSKEFFNAVAVSGFTFAGRETAAKCVAAINIAAGESAEIRLVALTKGRYTWSDNPMFFRLVFVDLMAFGTISID